MSKYFKYALAVATLLIACATFALADGSATVATVNGIPYSTLEEAVSASSSGDSLTLVSDYQPSGSVTIPAGVNFLIPDGVTLHFNGSNRLFVAGNIQSFGSITRTNTSTNNGLVNITGSGTGRFFGNAYSTTDAGIALRTTDSATVEVYGGSFFGSDIAVNRVDSSVVKLFGGKYSSINSSVTLGNPTFMLDSSSVQIVDGVKVRYGSVTLSTIAEIVSSSLNWISLFCAAIIANKLLLLFILFVFGFVGIGLIKRIIN